MRLPAFSDLGQCRKAHLRLQEASHATLRFWRVWDKLACGKGGGLTKDQAEQACDLWRGVLPTLPGVEESFRETLLALGSSLWEVVFATRIAEDEGDSDARSTISSIYTPDIVTPVAVTTSVAAPRETINALRLFTDTSTTLSSVVPPSPLPSADASSSVAAALTETVSTPATTDASTQLAAPHEPPPPSTERPSTPSEISTWVESTTSYFDSHPITFKPLDAARTCEHDGPGGVAMPPLPWCVDFGNWPSAGEISSVDRPETASARRVVPQAEQDAWPGHPGKELEASRLVPFVRDERKRPATDERAWMAKRQKCR